MDGYLLMFGGGWSAPPGCPMPAGFVTPPSYRIAVTNETWKWDGSVWTLLHPAHAPSPRTAYAMANDPNSQRVVLLGGGVANGDPIQHDMWSWDGNDWSALHPSTMPRWCESNVPVFDRDLKALVMAGCNATLQLDFSHYWSWDGLDWSYRSAGGSPPAPRFWFVFSYDPDHHQIAMAGGCEYETDITCRNDTWLLTNGSWSQAPVSGSSPAGPGGAAYDESRHIVLAQFPNRLEAPSAADVWLETWTWDGRGWTHQSSTHRAAINNLVYDLKLRQVIGFTVDLNVWGWNGVDWAQVA
jgi:hypothetical protein